MYVSVLAGRCALGMTVYLCRVPFAIAGQGILGDPGSESPLSGPELGIRKLQLAAASVIRAMVRARSVKLKNYGT